MTFASLIEAAGWLSPAIERGKESGEVIPVNAVPRACDGHSLEPAAPQLGGDAGV
jgi:hypothetical protein